MNDENSNANAGKLILVCLACVGIVSLIVLSIQFFTQIGDLI